MQDDIDYVGMVIAEDAKERAAKIGGLVERLVEAVADVGIENYVGSVVAVSDEGGTSQDVVVTVQRLNGKTPHELREEAEAANAELRQQLAGVTAERDELKAALKFYADGDHYSIDDGLNWDSCSGEPSNILWHEEQPWFIEDGSVARAVLNKSAEVKS